MPSSSSSSAVRRSTDGRITPAPTPHAANILRQIARLLEYGDTDTLASLDAFLTFRLEILSARDEAVH